MEIVWLGHSALRLRSGDVTLITDPYADSVGRSMADEKADIVTVSHEHPHHAHYQAIQGEPRVLRGPGEFEVASYRISGMGTPRGGQAGDRQINTVFTIRAEGLTVCHLGDLFRPLSPGQVQEISRMDILFVPGGGSCTIDANRAAELVNLLRPKIVVPIHYRVDGLAADLEPVEAFLSELGVSSFEPKPRLNVTVSNLPRELEVTVLKVNG